MNLEKLTLAEMTPSNLKNVSDLELLSLNRRLHQLWGANFSGNDVITVGSLNREDLLNAALFVWAEMTARGMSVSNDTELWSAGQQLVKFDEEPWSEPWNAELCGSTFFKSEEVDWLPEDKEEIGKAAYPSDVDNVVVMFSGGKDSVAALIWATEHFPLERIVAFNVDTGCEYKGMKAYIKTVCKKLGVKTQFVHAPMDFLEFLTKNKYGQQWNIESRACWYNGKVKVPSAKVARKAYLEKLKGSTLIIEGSRAEESIDRSERGRSGTLWEDKSIKVYRPCYSMSEAKVWKVLRDNGVKPFWAYEEGAWRFGCWCCPFTSIVNVSLVRDKMNDNWKRWLRVEKKRKVTKRTGTLSEIAEKGATKRERTKERMQAVISGESRRSPARVFRKAYAPILPSGLGTEEPISFDEVVSDLQPILIREPFVTVVGSVCNQRESRNDVDIVIHGPLDEATRHVVEFRLGRMFKPEVSQRLQFHDDSMGGPFTCHAHLYNLALIPRDDATCIVEMAQKQDDPHMDIPEKSGPRQSAIQIHTRGKTVHFDLRFLVADYLVGWTLPCGIKDAVPDINSIAGARALYVGYSAKDGNRFLKPVLAPNGLLAEEKARQPVDWLKIEARVFEPGNVGATAEEQGVIIAVARPGIEWGLQKPYFHEYFFTEDKVWCGPFFVRQLLGQGGTEAEIDQGTKNPENVPFWRAMLSKVALPSVLGDRAYKKGTMPELGRSAIPKTLEEVTPSEFRYWEADTEKDALETRNALVDAKFFTEENVKIVDGQFRRIVTKRFVYQEKALAPKVPFTLSWLFFRGPMVVRSGPSRQSWLLMLKDGDNLQAWELQYNPSGNDSPITGVFREFKGLGLLAADQELKPGEAIDGNVLNETKDTPAWLRIQDKGEVRILEESDSFIKLDFDGDDINGSYTLTREEPNSDIWVFEKSGLPTTKKAEPEDSEEYEAETKRIAENKKKPEAQQRHKFRQAKFTTKNGHSRCLLCGDEETLCGFCHGKSDDCAECEAQVSVELSKDESDKVKSYSSIWGGPAGKKNLVKRIIGEIPSHTTYVEPFAGSGVVLFKKAPSDVEVVGDIDSEIAFAFKFARSATQKEVEALKAKNWKGSKEAFDKIKSSNPKSKVERFYRFLYCARFAWNGRSDRGFASSEAGNTTKVFDRFERNRERLKSIIVRNKDYEEVIKEFDGKSTFLFLDPPYAQVDAGVNNEAFDEERFFKVLKSIKGNFFCTYQFKHGTKEETKAQLLKGFFVRKWGHKAGDRVNGGLKKQYTLIITNYDPDKVKDYHEDVSKVDGEREDFPSRVDLKPDERFRPMKPEGGINVGEFTELEPLFENFATEPRLKAGIFIEPKLNGYRVIASRNSQGKVSIWFEDSAEERSPALPKLTKELESIPGQFILDGELIDYDPEGNVLPRASLARFSGDGTEDDSNVKLNVFRVLFWNSNLTEEDEFTQHSNTLPAFFEQGKWKHVQVVPFQLARDEENARKAIAWAKDLPGSEGAMLKLSDATYSLGGGSSSWAKLKMVRRINAIVLDKNKVEGSDNTFNYTCGIGPVKDDEGFSELIEYDGKKYVRIGVTGNTNVQANVGDIIQAHVFELFVDRTKGKRTVHWFGPAIVEQNRSDLKQPMTVDEVESLATSTEVKKHSLIHSVSTIPILKTKEERYVLGVVLEPNDGENGAPLDPDTQKDIYSADEIKNAAWKFMEEFRNIGFMHESLITGRVVILESYVSPVDFCINLDGEVMSMLPNEPGWQHVRKGTWLLGLRIVDDELWKAIKQNKLTGLSIGGSARRVDA